MNFVSVFSFKFLSNVFLVDVHNVHCIECMNGKVI